MVKTNKEPGAGSQNTKKTADAGGNRKKAATGTRPSNTSGTRKPAAPGTKPATTGGAKRPAAPGTRPATTGRGPAGGNRRRRYRPKVKTTSKKQPMLNMHKINSFKYDMNTVLSESSMDEDKASSFLATIIAKASRNSTREAKAHVKTFFEDGDLIKKEHDDIMRLLDRYSRYR